MSNALTGDYDAVVEVNVETLNRVLASVHHNGAAPEASPTFLHSVTVRTGRIPRSARLELAETFLLENFESTDIGAIPEEALHAIQQDLLDTQKAAAKIAQDVAKVLPRDSVNKLPSVIRRHVDIAVVRGTAQVQVGTLALGLAPGSMTEVVVHAPIRAHYAPDPGTLALPTPIHGEVRAAFTLAYNPSGRNGKPALEVKATTDRRKVAFIPASETPAADQTGPIVREIQRFVTTKFGVMSAELPQGFKFGQFKSLVAGSASAIALPVKLSGGQLPATALASVTNLFLQPTDAFAIAISTDYLNTMLQPLLQEMTRAISSVSLDTSAFSFEVSVTRAWLESGPPDVLTVALNVDWRVWRWRPSGQDLHVRKDFTITQDLTVALAPGGTGLSLSAKGDPTPSARLGGDLQDAWERALPRIRLQRDAALIKTQPQTAAVLAAIPFADALRTFDAGARADFSSLNVTGDGLILRGSTEMSSPPSRAGYPRERSTASCGRSAFPIGRIRCHGPRP